MELKIGLIGKGTVGTSFLKLLKEKEQLIEEIYGVKCIITAVFERDGAFIDDKGINPEEILNNYSSLKKTNIWKSKLNAKDFLSELDLDICIETTTTNPETAEPGLTHILIALKNKIDVISSNKAPFYLAYNMIKKVAQESNSIVKYEATVGSGIPVLSIKELLLGTSITGIKAILNGTNNYILSRMTSEGISFNVALKEAQELGYAEANPYLDISGHDAAGKLVILANELLNRSFKINDVQIEGISNVTPQAIELAILDGYVIKHLAIVEEDQILVEPRLIKKDSPLNVSGTLNIIEIETKHTGSLFLIGNGAGGNEAASAILNDMLCIIKERLKILDEEGS
jgi:homoserine dehydrogenase